MKALILAVALVAVIVAPMVAFACPPPGTAGTDYSSTGGDPAGGGDSGATTDGSGGKDTDSGSTGSGATTGKKCA